MWARVVEFMLGCWLLCGPFIFMGENRGGIGSWVDFSLGGAIILFSWFAWWRPTRYAHLLTAVLSVGMFLVPRFTLSPEIPPAAQNYMMTALLLAMFSIIPNHADQPPKAWQEENAKLDMGQPTPEG